MKLKYTLMLGFGLIAMLAFVSCQLDTESTTATLPSTTTASVASLPTVSPLPTVTMEAKGTTPAPTVVVARSSPTIIPSTITPSATLAPPTIVPVTLTPLPTLTAEELDTAVAALLANPMNCDVPCWWGAVPNATTVFELQQLLALYQFEDYYRRDDDDNQIPDYIEVWVTEDEFDFRVMYSFQNDILQTVFSEQSPPLYEVLKRYEEPDKVWLSAFNDPRETHPTVWLNMVYLQKGMAVLYVVDADIQNDTVTGCFANEETGSLRLITSDRATSHQDFSKIFTQDRRFLPLEEATDMTMDDFIQQFSEPTQPQCIETPAELWDE